MRSPSKYPRNHHFSWEIPLEDTKIGPRSQLPKGSPAGPSRPELHRNSAVANPGHGRLRDLPWKFHSCELPEGTLQKINIDPAR